MADLFNSPMLLIEQPNKKLNYQIFDPQGTPLAQAGQVAGEDKGGFARFFGNDDMSRVVLQVSAPGGAPLFYLDRAQGMAQSAVQPPCAVVAPDRSLIGRVEHNTAAFAQSRLATGGQGGQQAYRIVDTGGQPLCDIVAEPEFVQMRRERTLGYGTDQSDDRFGNQYGDRFGNQFENQSGFQFGDQDSGFHGGFSIGGEGRYDDQYGDGGYRETPEIVGGRYTTYTDMNGVQIAHTDLTQSGMIADRFSLQINYQLPDPLRTLVIASPIAIDLMNGE
jgi:hypothetical protein